MRFSIIVPAYNAERYLDKALDSIAHQTFDDYEAVLVDDGSTDRTGAILDEFAAAHENAQVVHSQNNGLLLARRLGLAHAQGDYIVFLDADDRLRRNALERCDQELRTSNVDVVAFRYTTHSNDWRPTDQLVLPAGVYVGGAYQEVRACSCEGRICGIWGKAIRRSCFDIDVGYELFRGLMHGEDIFTTLPVIDTASSFALLDEALIFYRLHDDSSTGSYRSSQLTDIGTVIDRMRFYAVRWECGEEHAAKGEMLQYLYLARIAAHSPVPVHERDADLAEICRTMRERDVFERCRCAPLRPDYRLIAWCLERSAPRAARLAICAIDTVKGIHL